MNGMEIHGVRNGRVEIFQGEVQHVAFFHANHRTGNGPVERSGVVKYSFRNFHIRDLRGHFDADRISFSCDDRCHGRLIDLLRVRIGLHLGNFIYGDCGAGRQDQRGGERNGMFGKLQHVDHLPIECDFFHKTKGKKEASVSVM